MRVPWLAEVLVGAGCAVVPLDGWHGRGRELLSVDAVIWHATITSARMRDDAVAHLLRDGRPDLKGPLAQLGLDRQGRWWLITDGRGNHNIGQYGNQSIGIEAFNDGSEAWPTAQVDSWQRGTAAILAHLGLPVGRMLSHKEANPPRKSDPAGLDMGVMRRRVAGHLDPVAPPDDDEEALWLVSH